MKIGATFAQTWQPPETVTVRLREPRRRLLDHPSTSDQAAIERALTVLAEASKRHAIAQKTTPEADMEGDAFRQEHGVLAYLIRDPIDGALQDAISLLTARLLQIVPAQELQAIAERIHDAAGPLSRYAADPRPRH